MTMEVRIMSRKAVIAPSGSRQKELVHDLVGRLVARLVLHAVSCTVRIIRYLNIMEYIWKRAGSCHATSQALPSGAYKDGLRPHALYCRAVRGNVRDCGTCLAIMSFSLTPITVWSDHHDKLHLPRALKLPY
jgi:hypothetical protein